MRAALAIETLQDDIRVVNNQRNIISYDGSDSDERIHWLIDRYGAKIVRSYQFQIDRADVFDRRLMQPDAPSNPSLDDGVGKDKGSYRLEKS